MHTCHSRQNGVGLSVQANPYPKLSNSRGPAWEGGLRWATKSYPETSCYPYGLPPTRATSSLNWVWALSWWKAVNANLNGHEGCKLEPGVTIMLGGVARRTSARKTPGGELAGVCQELLSTIEQLCKQKLPRAILCYCAATKRIYKFSSPEVDLKLDMVRPEINPQQRTTLSFLPDFPLDSFVQSTEKQ